jgi:WD40 repeat protein
MIYKVCLIISLLIVQRSACVANETGELDRPHTGPINSVAISPDDQFVLSGGDDGAVKLWNVMTKRIVRSINADSFRVRFVGYFRDGKRVLTGGEYGKLCVWDVESGELLLTTTIESRKVSSAAFSSDGRLFVTGGGAATLWESAGKFVRNYESVFGSVKPVAISPDGQTVLTGSAVLQELKLWSTGSGKLVRRWKDVEPINSVAFTPDGRFVVSGGGLGTVGTLKMWNAATGRLVKAFNVTTGSINSLAISPDGQQIVSGSWSKKVEVWNLDRPDAVLSLDGHEGAVSSIAISSDSRWFVSVGTDSRLKFWSAVDGKLLFTVGGTPQTKG